MNVQLDLGNDALEDLDGFTYLPTSKVMGSLICVKIRQQAVTQVSKRSRIA